MTAAARRSALGLLAVLAWGAGAQQAKEPAFQTEARVDGFFASGTALQLGGGGAWVLSRDLRLVALAGLGSTLSSGNATFSGRADLLARFVLDPDRVNKWSLYGEGGLGVQSDTAGAWRGVLVAVVGLEGPNWGTWMPFAEAGYGGGLQIGLGLRRAKLRGR